MKARMSLRSTGKAIALVTALLALFAVAVVGVAQVWLKKEVALDMAASARSAMRVLAVTLADGTKGARADIQGEAVTSVTIESMPAFSDHGIVDRTEKMISGVVTIFQTRGPRDHVRLSTTVKKENGDRAVGTNLAPDHPAQPVLERGEAYYGPATLFGRDFITGYQPVKNAAGKTVGTLFIGIPTERADAMVARLTGTIAIVAIVVLAILVFIAFFVVARSVRPLSVLAKTVTRIGEGDLETEVRFTDRNDEIGDIAKELNVFKANALDNRRLVEEQREAEIRAAEEKRVAAEHEAAERHAATERQEMAAKEAMHKVIREFESAVGGIIELVSSSATELEATANTLNTTAGSTQRRSNEVAAASEEASANVQTVASATEELTASVNEISKQVEASSRIADQAVSQAEKTDKRIITLSQAASRIGDVVKLISSVAEQTNLLALNATIEAARAGEAGKGFAIVAQEVKALAGQTAKATEEIASQITGMQTATQESVVAIKEISGTIVKISEIAGAIASAVEEQGAATREIARNVEEASKGTSRVSANIEDVNRHASETSAASAQMLSSAQSLSHESNHLKIEMERFLDAIRTGVGNRRTHEDPNYAGPERRHDKLRLPAGSRAHAA